MSTAIERIKLPELFFGFVAPIGADMTPSILTLRTFLEANGYKVVELRVTDNFRTISKYLKPEVDLEDDTTQKRYRSYIAYGNQLRRVFEDDSILAVTSVIKIIEARSRLAPSEEKRRYSGIAYILRQFKRKEEIDLLRNIYGSLFFQVSVYSRRGARVEYLSHKFGDRSIDPTPFRAAAEEIIERDENESSEPHGQRVGSIFHDADLIINLDISTPTPAEQMERFCELIFGSNAISPTKHEYGMYAAKGAALRSIDLSRQIGAAIFTPRGEILSLGSNEVPKAGGGTYWPEDDVDDRDFRRGVDANEDKKRVVLLEIAAALGAEANIDELLANPTIKNSQLMDVMEYGRIVHAEMSAICDAARLGISVKGGVLYCTTFPCHICAKHIVDAGIDTVIFLEPYPKSRAAILHSDAVQVEGADRGRYAGFPAVKFEHFHGVTPRRYRELFERGCRKDKEGKFVGYIDGSPAPIVDVKSPFYVDPESVLVERAAKVFMEKLSMDHTALKDEPVAAE